MSKIIPHVPKTTGGADKRFASLRMRLAALAYSLAARHPQYINLASKVQRIVHARYQDLLKRGVAIAKHAQLRTQVSFYRAKQRTVAWTQRALHRSTQFAATLIAFSVALPFLLFVAGGDLKPSEVHLTAAQVIGAALALVLSLSIIPAQRAAEAFSPAILKLYARDRALLGAFVLLVVTTMGSVLLGTNFLGRSEPRWSIALQFILLGVSFDALRGFYSRVLELLVPQTAINLVVRECKKYQTRTSKEVERLVQIFSKAGGESDQQAASRALIYGASQLERGLQTWIAQLDEFGHKLIARRDTNAARVACTRFG